MPQRVKKAAFRNGFTQLWWGGQSTKVTIPEWGKNLNDSSLGLHCMDPIAFGTLQCSCSLHSSNFDRISPLLYMYRNCHKISMDSVLTFKIDFINQSILHEITVLLYWYSCSNITTTLIQISRLFYVGFFSKTNHQMII